MDYMEQKMQEQMEGAEHEYNELMEKHNPPSDWNDPQWDVKDKVHNWRNYITEAVKQEWPNFNGRQKIILAAMADDIAGQEHWE